MKWLGMWNYEVAQEASKKNLTCLADVFRILVNKCDGGVEWKGSSKAGH